MKHGRNVFGQYEGNPRNTPDPLTGLSPAMILFGRQLRDHLPAVLNKYQPRREWRLEADLREKSHAKRHAKMEERLSFGTKPLPPLCLVDTVTVQGQSNPLKPGKWSKTGNVVEILPHDSYMVVIHGSRAPTQRNRRFLRKISPFHPMIPLQADHPYIPPATITAPAASASTTPAPAAPTLIKVHDSIPAPAAEAVDLPLLPAAAPTPRVDTEQPAEAAHVPPVQPCPARTSTAGKHRQTPAAPPSQDIVTLMCQRVAQGQVLVHHLVS